MEYIGHEVDIRKHLHDRFAEIRIALAIIEAAVKTRRIVTVEEHNVIGGLGDAVAAVLAESGKRCILTKIGIPDEFGPIGKPEDLYAIYKLSSQGIMETVMELMGKEIEEDDWDDED